MNMARAVAVGRQSWRHTPVAKEQVQILPRAPYPMEKEWIVVCCLRRLSAIVPMIAVFCTQTTKLVKGQTARSIAGQYGGMIVPAFDLTSLAIGDRMNGKPLAAMCGMLIMSRAGSRCVISRIDVGQQPGTKRLLALDKRDGLVPGFATSKGLEHGTVA